MRVTLKSDFLPYTFRLDVFRNWFKNTTFVPRWFLRASSICKSQYTFRRSKILISAKAFSPACENIQKNSQILCEGTPCGLSSGKLGQSLSTAIFLVTPPVPSHVYLYKGAAENLEPHVIYILFRDR